MAIALTGEPVASLSFKGKTINLKWILEIFSRLHRFSTINTLFFEKIWWTENFLSVPISILGESIPTKLMFLEIKYFAAEEDKPGLFLKKDFFSKFFCQPVEKITVELSFIISYFFSKLIISVFVISWLEPFGIFIRIASEINLDGEIWWILLPFSTKWKGESRWVPVWELRKSNSRLYPSVLIFDHGIKWGFGEPGKHGMFWDMVSVRSIGSTQKNILTD